MSSGLIGAQVECYKQKYHVEDDLYEPETVGEIVEIKYSENSNYEPNFVFLILTKNGTLIKWRDFERIRIINPSPSKKEKFTRFDILDLEE